MAAGCASPVCDPVTIVVAGKKDYGRLDTVPGGFQTSGSGRLEEIQVPVAVREYWVQSSDGKWFRVPPEQYEAAAIDQPLRLCR